MVNFYIKIVIFALYWPYPKASIKGDELGKEDYKRNRKF